MQTAFEAADENVYYEDKLSIYITDVPNGSCAATCHLGVGPHSDSGEKHGVHYTRGEVGDIWHWKSVRTNPMGLPTGDPGLMDDQHFRAPDPLPLRPRKARYTAGYHADPKTGGGYTYNFGKLEPNKTLAETWRDKNSLSMGCRWLGQSRDVFVPTGLINTLDFSIVSRAILASNRGYHDTQPNRLGSLNYGTPSTPPRAKPMLKLNTSRWS